MRIVGWMDCCKHEDSEHEHGEVAVLSHHDEVTAEHQLQHHLIQHQVLGFCSDLRQKLRTDLSFPAPRSARIVSLDIFISGGSSIILLSIVPFTVL